jgi:hypothetical protein
MIRINYYRVACSTVCMLVMISGLAAAVFASPAPNSAVIKMRIFNDYPFSVVSTTNAYPATVMIQDDFIGPCCFANLHNWRFSEDGTNPAIFMNADMFRFAADLTITGTSNGEAGLQVAPWFSSDVDGRFNVRVPDGEIACFGGVLPFYSFTGAYGIRYERGQTIHLEINYIPNSNTDIDPATIEYKLVLNGQSYTSGPLSMGGCNVGEQPIYGCYGVLNFAQAGGFLQAFNGAPTGPVRATWSSITYSPDPKPTAAVRTTWGKIKTLYR